MADDNIEEALKSKKRVKNETILVGVHVRRGMDLAWNTRNQIHGHTIATKQYFNRAMDYFRQKYNSSSKRVLFLICSDDLYWSRQNLASGQQKQLDDVAIIAGSQKAREMDLAVLSSCDHVIMSTGTFSWWAAYLSGGEATYYENWPRPGSPLASMLNKSDYFLPEWKPMS